MLGLSPHYLLIAVFRLYFLSFFLFFFGSAWAGPGGAQRAPLPLMPVFRV